MNGSARHKAVGPAPVGEHTSQSRRRHHTSEPAGALLTARRRRSAVDEHRCDPRNVERGTRLVEAAAREEGKAHARAGKMRIRTIPRPFAMAYTEGYIDEWMRRNPLEETDA